MKQNKITLISLYNYQVFGLRIIQSILKKNEYTSPLIFLKKECLLPSKITPLSEKEIDIVIDFLKKSNTQLVGISLNTHYFNTAKKLTEEIKKRVHIPVVWGGAHPTFDPEQSIKVADAICIGEGEEAIIGLANYFLKKGPVNVANTWIKKRDKTLKNKFTQHPKDLNTNPFIDYSDENKFVIENGKIKYGDPLTRYFTLYTIFSRGCEFNCSFCIHSILNKIFIKRLRKKEIKNIIAEIIYAQTKFKRINEIKFLDENFPKENTWIKRFVEEYKKNINLPFLINLNPNLSDKNNIKLLKTAGLRDVIVGIQSGSEEIRKKVYNRLETNEKILELAKILKNNSLMADYDLIVDNPLEKKENKQQTLSLTLKLPRPFNIHLYSLMYFPNTCLTNNFLEDKIISQKGLLSDKQLNKYGFTFRHSRSNEDKFYTALISLTSKRFIPKSIIPLLEKIRFLEQNPNILIIFVELCNKIKFFQRGIVAILNGKISKQFLKDQIPSLKERVI